MKYVRLETRVNIGKEMKPGRAPIYILKLQTWFILSKESWS